MDKGLHPLDERYLDAYGLPERASDGEAAAAVRCPLCLRTLVPTGHSRGKFRYFRHETPEEDERCPLTTSSYQLDGMSVGHPRDLLGDLRYRRRFLQQWQSHYRMTREVEPWFSLEHFTRMIEYADVVNLWSYPVLRLHDVPYVLLVMAGFISARTAAGEPVRERFWFDGSVNDVGDLWRRDRSAPARLFRVVYGMPQHTPLPTAASILYWEPVHQARRLAEISVPRVSRGQVRAFARFLEYHEAQRRARASDIPEGE